MKYNDLCRCGFNKIYHQPLDLQLIAVRICLNEGNPILSLPIDLPSNHYHHTKECLKKGREKDLFHFLERDDIECARGILKNDPDLLCSCLILEAINRNSIKQIKNLKKIDCPWHIKTTSYAAKMNNLECMKFVHKNGCKWNESTTKEAAVNGSLDCMKFAHENGCMWSLRTVECAAQNGRLDCLEYAIQNGCMWSKTRTYNYMSLVSESDDKEFSYRLKKCREYLNDIKLGIIQIPIVEKKKKSKRKKSLLKSH